MSLSTLIGTTWEFSNVSSVLAGFGKYTLYGELTYSFHGGTTGTAQCADATDTLQLGYNAAGAEKDGSIKFITTDGQRVFQLPLASTSLVASIRFRVTGGIDATDTTLIRFLEDNAIQISQSSPRQRGVLVLNDATGSVGFTVPASLAQPQIPSAPTLSRLDNKVYVIDNNGAKTALDSPTTYFELKIDGIYRGIILHRPAEDPVKRKFQIISPVTFSDLSGGTVTEQYDAEGYIGDEESTFSYFYWDQHYTSGGGWSCTGWGGSQTYYTVTSYRTIGIGSLRWYKTRSWYPQTTYKYPTYDLREPLVYTGSGSIPTVTFNYRVPSAVQNWLGHNATLLEEEGPYFDLDRYKFSKAGAHTIAVRAGAPGYTPSNWTTISYTDSHSITFSNTGGFTAAKYSTDAGSNWSVITSGSTVSDQIMLKVDPSDSCKITAVLNGNTYTTTSKIGNTLLTQDGNTVTVSEAPVQYTVTFKNVYSITTAFYSTNSGSTWSVVPNGTTVTCEHIMLKVEPSETCKINAYLNGVSYIVVTELSDITLTQDGTVTVVA